MVEIFVRERGYAPDSALTETLNTCSEVHCSPQTIGIEPLKRLDAREKVVILTSCDQLGGNVPVSRLLDTSRVFILEQWTTKLAVLLQLIVVEKQLFKSRAFEQVALKASGRVLFSSVTIDACRSNAHRNHTCELVVWTSINETGKLSEPLDKDVPLVRCRSSTGIAIIGWSPHSGGRAH